MLLNLVSSKVLTHHGYVESLAKSLCRMSPIEAWGIVASHLLSSAPEWRVDIINWLKGRLDSFDGKEIVPPITEFPFQLVLNWIELDPEVRALMIADCSPCSLDDEFGGALTRALLTKYRDLKGVVGFISFNFQSDCWKGPRSQHLRATRDQFRNWLGKDFDVHVRSWIDEEIVYLDREIEAAEISEEREAWNRS